MCKTLSLVELASSHVEAKRREDKAKQERIDIEEAIIALAKFKKAEGQERYEDENAIGRCVFVLKQPVSTKVDAKAWLALRRTLDKNSPIRKLFIAKYSLDLKLARALQADDKEHGESNWAKASECITRKPGKVSVEVKSVFLKS